MDAVFNRSCLQTKHWHHTSGYMQKSVWSSRDCNVDSLKQFKDLILMCKFDIGIVNGRAWWGNKWASESHSMKVLYPEFLAADQLDLVFRVMKRIFNIFSISDRVYLFFQSAWSFHMGDVIISSFTRKRLQESSKSQKVLRVRVGGSVELENGGGNYIKKTP